MIGPAWGILAVCATLAAMFGGLKLLERLIPPHPELLRKLLHVGMGLVVISFPWVFAERWPVVLLAGIAAAFLAAVKLVPKLHDGIGTVVTAVHRPSLGEVCFPAAVAALILLSRGDKLLFVVPMLIMTLADTVAALVGIAYGKVRYVTSDGFKSAEGSIAFFTIAFLSVHVPLLLFTQVGRAQTLLISVIIGLLSMVIEAISARGLDNLLIPLGTFAFLRLYLDATIHGLLVRLAATVLLLIFALSWRRRTTLDDSALMACALFGYGVAMLAGPVWLIAPMILFLLHSWMWPRFGPRRMHSVFAVASIVVGALLWVGLQVAFGGRIRFLFPYAVGFGAHLAIIGVSRIAVDPSPRPHWIRLGYSIVAGWMLAMMQMLPVLIHGSNSAGGVAMVMGVGLAGVTAGAMGFYLLLPFLYGSKGSDSAIHWAGFSSALVGSILAAEIPLAMASGWALS